MVFMLLHKRQVDKQRETYIKSFLSEASCKLPKLRVLRRWCRHPLFLSFFLQRIPWDSFTSSFSFCVLILFLSSKCPICFLSLYFDYPVSLLGEDFKRGLLSQMWGWYCDILIILCNFWTDVVSTTWDKYENNYCQQRWNHNLINPCHFRAA